MSSLLTELAPEDRTAVHPAVLSHAVRAALTGLLPALAVVLKYSDVNWQVHTLSWSKGERINAI